MLCFSRIFRAHVMLPAAFCLMAQADGQGTSAPAQYAEQILPFLDQHCFACHDDSTQKGRLRLDVLKADFSTPDLARKWTAVFDQIQSGEMPPRKKSRPPQEESRAVLQWVADGLITAEAERSKTEGSGVLRRLNRVEYENTVRDLLGIQADLQEHLPQDPSLAGFDHVGEAMRSSAILLERYLDAADAALDAATANRKKPWSKSGVYRFDSSKVPEYLSRHAEERDGNMVFFATSPRVTRFRLESFSAPADGLYRVRIHASASGSGDRPVHYGVRNTVGFAGGLMLGYFEAPPGKPGVTELMVNFRHNGTLSVNAYAFSLFRIPHTEGEPRPGVMFHDIEIEGPLNPVWPPPAHEHLFGKLPLKPLDEVNPASIAILGKQNASEILTPVADQPEEEVARLVRKFLPRAFRRPVSDEEAQVYVNVAQAKLKNGGTFEEAVRVGMKTILTSPSFLFLREAPGRLDDFALASRLSYFLWSTTPDTELLQLAHQRELSRPAVLHAQVERLLKHPKARNFVENFTGQWLALREINATAPDVSLYPEFDEWLQMSMMEESHRFFQELIDHDFGATNIVSSDFAMLNERLAVHYGIDGVEGLPIRKVLLPPGSRRGGVLTQGSVLKVTANGTTSSPIIRGAWVMKNIIGKPIPPPPENVPAIEPDIRGAANIRDQLAMHRNLEACASCHNKMDPPGMALESFDVIGGWREQYRILEPKKTANVMVNGSKVKYNLGQPVDPSGELVDGRAFADIDELKKYLLADPRDIARAITSKLLVYATGRAPTFTDRKHVEAILQATQPENYGLRSIIHHIIRSDAFLNK